MKLWFFRTHKNHYGIACGEMSPHDMSHVDRMYGCPTMGTIGVSEEESKEFPDISPGECVPVELQPVGKIKKARKG